MSMITLLKVKTKKKKQIKWERDICEYFVRHIGVKGFRQSIYIRRSVHAMFTAIWLPTHKIKLIYVVPNIPILFIKRKKRIYGDENSWTKKTTTYINCRQNELHEKMIVLNRCL